MRRACAESTLVSARLDGIVLEVDEPLTLELEPPSRCPPNYREDAGPQSETGTPWVTGRGCIGDLPPTLSLERLSSNCGTDDVKYFCVLLRNFHDNLQDDVA